MRKRNITSSCTCVSSQVVLWTYTRSLTRCSQYSYIFFYPLITVTSSSCISLNSLSSSTSIFTKFHTYFCPCFNFPLINSYYRLIPSLFFGWSFSKSLCCSPIWSYICNRIWSKKHYNIPVSRRWYLITVKIYIWLHSCQCMLRTICAGIISKAACKCSIIGLIS